MQNWAYCLERQSNTQTDSGGVLSFEESSWSHLQWNKHRQSGKPSVQSRRLWYDQILTYLFDLLPLATKLGQGYVFAGVCDSVHGGSASVHAGMLGYPPPQSRHTPPPPEQAPSPAQSMLGDTVNARAVRILLECNPILVIWEYCQLFWNETQAMAP